MPPAERRNGGYMKKNMSNLVYSLILSFAMFFVFAFSFYKIASAKSITLPNWRSTSNWVGYWSSEPKVFFTNLSSSFDISSYVNTAVNKWKADDTKNNLNGIDSMVTVSAQNASIRYYSGTRAELNSIGFVYTSSLEGLTDYVSSTKAADADNLNYVKKLSSVKASTAKEAANKACTTIHEYGHALGWSGHSQHSTDIMYKDSKGVTTISVQEKRHLAGVYKKMK